MREAPAGVNAEQVAAWNGPDGDHWVEHEAIYNAAVRRHARHMFYAARVDAGDRVLDVGCGCGESTRQAARLASTGRAVGIDVSERQIARACEHAAAEGVSNVEFVHGDAQTYRFEPGASDVVISRFGAMYFDRPGAAFANLRAALRPGGRLALLAWQPLDRNAWVQGLQAVVAAGRKLPEPPADSPGPFGLARAEHVRALIDDARFEQVALSEVDEPIRLGADADEAYAFVSTQAWVQAALREAGEAARREAERRLRHLLEAHQSSEGVLLGSKAWLITARRP